jgi:chaperonin GroES
MSWKNIKPLGDRVLVKRSEEKKTRGGILLPDTAKEKPKEGEIVAVGPGKMDKEGKVRTLNVSKGDRVLFTSYAGAEVKTEEDAEYLIMSEDDILGVLV